MTQTSWFLLPRPRSPGAGVGGWGARVVVAALAVTAAAGVHAAADRSAPPALGPVPALKVSAPTAFALPNGLRVWHVPSKRAPLVDVLAVVDAGALRDPDDAPGTAASLDAMLLEGAGDRGALALADEIATLGATVETEVGWDSLTVHLHTQAAVFDKALPLFVDVLRRPRLEDDAWQRVRGERDAALAQKATDPRTLGGLAQDRVLYGDSRRGLDLEGTRAALQRTTPTSLRAFHRRHVRPDTTILIVTGDISAAQLRALLTAHLGDWGAEGERDKPLTAAAPSSPPSSPPSSKGAARVLLVDVPGAPQTVVGVVAKAPPSLDAYDAPFAVMNTLLGASFTSRLNDNLRERNGYSYGARSRLERTRAGTSFRVGTSVATPVTAKALVEIQRELSRLRDEAATDVEVKRASQYAALSFPQAFDGSAATAFLWASAAEDGTDPARVLSFVDRAAAVDGAALQASARATFDEPQMSYVLVGDASIIEADVKAAFGDVTRLDAATLVPAP